MARDMAEPRGVPGIGRQAEFFETLCNALFTKAPNFRARYAAAVLAEFPALGVTLDDGSDETTRARREALPAAYAWLTGAAPVLTTIPPDILQTVILFVTPWAVDPDGPAPTVHIGNLEPTIPLPALRPDLRKSPAAIADQAVRAYRSWLDALRAFSPPTDLLRVRSLHLTPDEAWEIGRPWPALETHVRWWAHAHLEGRSPTEIAGGTNDSPDAVSKAIRRIDQRLGVTGLPKA